MRIRLLQIGLRLDDHEFLEGSEVVAGVDIPVELAAARLAAHTAEIVSDGELVSADLLGAVAGFEIAAAQFVLVIAAMIEAVKTSADVKVVRAALEQFSRDRLSDPDPFERLAAIERADQDQAEAVLRGQTNDVSTETGEPSSAASGEAVLTSASDGAAPDGASASDVSSDPPEGDPAQGDAPEEPASDAGDPEAIASTDNPSSEGGPAAAPSEASVSGGDPAEGVDLAKTPKTKTGRAASKVEG